MFLIYILKINQNKNQKSIYIKRNETSKILICILIVTIS